MNLAHHESAPRTAGMPCPACGGARRWRDMAIGESFDVTDLYASVNAARVHACNEGAKTGNSFRTSKKTGRIIIRRDA